MRGLTQQKLRIGIVGGSAAGALFALALSSDDVSVSIIDPHLGSTSAASPAVPQADQLHTIVDGGVRALGSIAPKILEYLKSKGALPHDPGRVMRYTEGDGWTPSVSTGLKTIFVQRSIFDDAIHNELLSNRSIFRIKDRVRQVNTGHDDLVYVETDKHGNISFDFLIIATGKKIKIAPQIDSILSKITEKHLVDLSIQTATYKWTSRAPADWKAIVIGESPAHGGKGSYLIDTCDGFFSVAHGIRGGAPIESTEIGMQSFARGLPDRSISRILASSQFVEAAKRYRFKYATRRTFEHGNRTIPSEILVVGDAHICTNPMYGLGISMAAIGASTLKEILKRNGITKFCAVAQIEYYRIAGLRLNAAWQATKFIDEQFGPDGFVHNMSTGLRDGFTKARWRFIEDAQLIASFLRVAQLAMVGSPISMSEVSLAGLRSLMRPRVRFNPLQHIDGLRRLSA